MTAPDSIGISNPSSPMRSPAQNNGTRQAIAAEPPRPLNLAATPAKALAELVSRFPTGEFICIGADGHETTQSYRQLWDGATKLLAGLRSLDLKPGTPIIFQLSRRHDFVTAFWSCLLGGFIPVPMSVTANKVATAKLSNQLGYILGTLNHAVVLSDRQLSGHVQTLVTDLLHKAKGNSPTDDKSPATVVEIESLTDHPSASHFHQAAPDDLALFLLSSGTTTGRAKLITFDAKTVIRRLLATAPDATDQQPIVSLGWLPLHSIGGLKLAVPKAIKKIHLLTEGLLQNPLLFLESIQKHRVTHTSATNFFLNLLNEQLVQTTQKWDLSSVELVSVGAEAIVAKTAVRSLTILTTHGLPSGVLRPAYGMSECGLLASGNKNSFEHYPPLNTETEKITETNGLKTTEKEDSSPYIEIGSPTPGHSIRIVDSTHRLLNEQEVGLIQIQGPTMTAGYYRNTAQNEQLFTPDGWLNTGDLGFLERGRLTVTGRAKEIVIINALNIAIADVEQALVGVEGVSAGSTVACGVRNPNGSTDELLICFAPTDADADWVELINQMRQQVVDQLGINPRYFVPVAKSDIPRTETGKVQRQQLKQRFEQGEFDKVIQRLDKLVQQELASNYVAPTTELEKTLARIFEQILSLSSVGIHDNFFELGGHSLLATRLVSRIRTRFGVELPIQILFEAPTIAGLATTVEQAVDSHTLTDGQNNGQSNEQSNKQSNEQIRLVSRKERLPLSSAQKRLWVLDQIEDDNNTIYNLRRTLQLKGALDIEALEKSLNEIVRRHEALRTTFSQIGTQPVQVVNPPSEVQLPQTDFRTVPDTEKDAAVQQKIESIASHRFDLEQGPLFQFELLKVTDQAHILAFNIHHIVFDGWSFRVLFQELSELYSAFCQQHPSPLSPLPIQYADFASWQQQWIDSEHYQQQLAYWKQHLADAPPALDLPTDYPRPEIQQFSGAAYSHKIAPSLQRQLLKFSQAESSTLFMTMLSAFKLLCYRFTNQEKITVGSPIAGRSHSEVEQLLGFFVGNLVMHSDLSGAPSCRELVRRVRQTALEAYANQSVPFDLLLQEIQPPRDLSRTPLFQVWFNMVNLGELTLSLKDLEAELLHTSSKTAAMFDITLYIRESKQGLSVQWVYNTTLFQPGTIEYMAQCFQAVLEGIVTRPDQSITALTLPLPVGTQSQLLGTHTEQTTLAEIEVKEIEQSIPARFAQQVKKHGQRTAVKTPQYEWTYTELDDRANQIAAGICHQCESAEQVALLFEHDAPMIAGMLGVLKAGKAYVALDPSYPKERLQYILQDSKASVVLADKQTYQFAQSLIQSTENGAVTVVSVDSLSTSDHFSEPDISPDARAYILYTSGSTGKPKGVIQVHRNVQHFIWQQAQLLNIQPGDRLSLVASYSFDAAIVDIFSALLNGATLYPIAVKMLSPAEIGQWIADNQITIYHSTPTLYRTLLSYYSQTTEQVGSLGSIRAVILGGEETRPADIYQYQSYFAEDCRFVNLYGSTESTIGLQYVVPQGVDTELRSLPVGYPIINTEVLLLSETSEPAQVMGEIAIRSAYLALGYWQQTERSQEAFLPDPEGGNRRIYRTGDLGRRRADGTIEFLGRRDFQIKLRGFRIEPGEIENVLVAHPHVQKAVVIIREDTPGDQRLVGYVVPHDPSHENNLPTALREWSEQQLPDYMMPSTFAMLGQLPLTPSGKIDRLSLPAPEPISRQSEADFTPPQTLTEQKLAQIWIEILGVEDVGIHDSFFELGGHSLLATQLFARIRANFATSLSLRHLFESPTIAEIAIAIEKEGPKAQQVAIKPIENHQRVPLSSTQKRLWILDQLEGNGSAYSIRRAMRLLGSLSVPVLERSLSEIVRRHEILRTTFEIASTEPVQVVNPPMTIQLSVADLRELPAADLENELHRRVAAAAAHRFDLQQGPLFHFELFRVAEDEHIFVTNIHHIVFDGWSYRLLFREMSLIYSAYSKDLPSSLPELSVQYADFTDWQQKWLQTDEYQTQLNYWKTHMAGAPYVLELPTDYPRPAIQKFDGAMYRQQLSLPVTEQLLTFSRQEKATLFMVMLSAFKLLCYRFTSQERITIGSPIAGRSQAELEQLMGFFVSNLVLHTDLSGEPTCRELLSRVRQTALDAYSNQDVPFEALLEELQPPRDLSRTPLFQVWFNMVNLSESKLNLSELEIKPLKSRSKTSAKFDLTIYIRESAQGLSIQWVYNTTLFQESTIDYMSTCFQSILEAMVARPDQSISTLPLPSPQQSDQWKSASPITLDYTPFNRADIEQSIPARFAQQVKKHGERIAIKTLRYEWSYQALDYESDRIAAGVLAQRNQTDTQQIALLFDHDAPMVAGMLGVLKLGRAYVALDPSYPKERLQYILEDSQASMILASKETLELANELTNNAGSSSINIVNTGTLPQNFEQPALKSSPDDLAYILYTSGSTGKPKGVMQNHRNVLHFIQVYTNNLHISEQDKITLLSSYSFDAAVMDIFGALMNGATLYPIDIKREGLDYLSQQLNDEKITIYHSTPTLYRYFLSSLPESSNPGSSDTAVTFPHTRLVVMGGEAVNKHDVDLYKAHFPADAIFVNGLGPSESTVTLQQFVDKEVSLHLNNVPVGYPVAETEVLLLNSEGEESQIYGEIAIRSRHVALGYWRRPKLNKTAFIESTDGSQKRTYRTGDLGRLRSSGSLEFLGRKDFQVKLRGFRIELGEVESVLAQHPEVKKCVVVGREEQPGELYLAAYFVPTDEAQAPETETLRQFMGQKLPDYMVPAAIVCLAELPLTPSGKVDRKALPTPEDFQQGTEVAFVAPQTSVQKALANIWATVLKVKQVGLNDNFFMLGGHSLMATQVISRIQSDLNTKVSLRYLFEAPTIAELASVIESEKGESQSTENKDKAVLSFEITPVPRNQDIPLSFAQQRLWFLDQLEGTSATYVLSRSLLLSGGWDIALLKQAIAHLMNRHEVLRTTIHTVDNEPVQVISPPYGTENEIAIPIVDLRSFSTKKAKTEVRRLTKQLTEQPFALNGDALIRFELIQLPNNDHRLLIAIHHIITDGWSMNILTKELLTTYQDLLQSRPSTLTPLPIQYADFAYWQRQWLQGDELNRQLGYWQKQLTGAPPLLALPTDYPRPAIQTFKGKSHTFKLDETTTKQLSELSQRSGTTLFMTLLSAFSVFLYRYAQVTDIVVGSPIANRTRKEIEPLIGFFANTLLLRTKLQDNPDFSEVLKQVRRTALDAYAHQDMPFEKLVEVLQPERSSSYNPLFQVMFVLHNKSANALQATDQTADQTIDVPANSSTENGSAASPLMTTAGTKRTTAKFDLNLSMVETRAGLRGSWTYSTELFKPETIDTMVIQFQALLTNIVRNPNSPIDSLSLLSVAQQQKQVLDQKMQEKISFLSPAKRALLEKKLTQKKLAEAQNSNGSDQTTQGLQTKSSSNAIVPRTGTEAAELSFSQQNLWLLDQLNPGNPGYNRPTHLSFSGPLDISALERSIGALVHRHEILRTRFTTSTQGRPVQTVVPEMDIEPLSVEDLCQLSADLQRQTVRERAIAQAHAHFDLRTLPLFKTQLLKLKPNEHLLLITFHHIVFDGWSTSILVKDLGALYGAFARGAEPTLPALPIQYADFALWQQQQLKTASMEAQLAYWKQQLSGQPAILELPTDRPRTASKTVEGGEHTFELSQALKQQLTAIAQKENATLFMVLLATFKTLLYRYTQEEDIIVGSPVTGRNSVETEELIGLFVNTLVLRTGLQGQQSFQSLLQQVRQTALDAFAHQGVPLPKLVESLQIDRDLSRSTLFQILFQFKNLPDESIEAQNVLISERRLETNIAGLDLSLEVKEKSKGLACLFKYDASLFDASTIQRMGSHFLTLLESVVADAGQSLAQLSMLSAAERSQITLWNTATPQSIQSLASQTSASVNCIHELFEQQVARVPDAIALSYLDQQLTYQELNALANQLARKLQTLGVQPDTPVGVYLPRSPQLLISLLAVLKAGGAYVPLDADALPIERVQYVLQDTQSPVLVTHADLAAQLSLNTTTVALAIDTQWDDDIANEATTNLEPTASLQHLAYLIYTSGSTGQPKGAMLEHGGLLDAFYSWNQAYDLPSLNRHLQLAGFSFDVFTGDWVRALCSGAQLVLCPSELKLEPAKLYALMRQEQIDCAEFVPGIIRILVEHLSAAGESFDFMKLMIVGSDAWYMREYRQLQTFCGADTRLVNSYGLTEDTIDTTFFESDRANTHNPTPLADEALVPIGRPFANKQLFILDDQLQPSPIGIPGQLYVSGSGLARGYLNRLDLTAERFVDLTDSVSENTTANQPLRVYKTGDLARYLSDGNVEFLGRLDFQVKIRGFRIELGEIEVALLKLPEVQTSVVVQKTDPTGSARLVAYIILSEEAQRSEESSEGKTPDWRNELHKQLPSYMVPSVFVVLEALPLTPSGKVDRKRLPQPDFSQLSLTSQYEAPTTTTEKMLAKLWSEILNVESIGIHDNFFELGGHSLLATQVISRIRSTFSVEIPLRSLFEEPTIAGLSDAITQQATVNPSTDQQATGASGIDIIQPVPRNEQLPLSFTQQRLWLINQIETESTAYSMRKTLKLTGALNVAALERSLSEIIARHEVLRTTIGTVEGQPVQVIHPPSAVSLPVITLQSLPDQQKAAETKQHIAAVTKHLFDLEAGPLYKFGLIQVQDAEQKQTEQSEHILAINIHHIVFDGWSFGLFFKELSVLYRAFTEGTTPKLKPLPIQYADFAYWQQQWLHHKKFQTQLSYWKQHLADAPYVLELPTDFVRPAVQTHTGANLVQKLPLSLKQQLTELSLQEGTTMFMTLLAAFKLLCYRLTNQQKITIGSPIAGRNQSEVEKLMGFFISNLVLYTDLSGNPSGRELLHRVKQVSLESYANQDIPFEALLEVLQPPRDLSRTPLFQVWFNMLNIERSGIDIADLDVTSISSEASVNSKFDLTLYVSETPEGLRIRWVYNTNLFKKSTIKHFSQCFAHLLESLVKNPDAKITSLPLLPARKLPQSVVSPIETPFQPFAKAEIEQSITARFAKQVKQHANQIAIKTPRYEWTYKTLDQQADKIAAGILQQSQRPEQVALLFEHDAPMIASMLGVLKLGNAYVALDPNYPVGRLQYILQDSQASVILASQQTFAFAQELAGDRIPVINTDTLPTAFTSPKAVATADSLAYILYTSGSTGKPKGVMQNHRNVLHFIRVYTNNLHVSDQDKLTLLSSYSFDAAVMDIFGALLNGATLYPVDIKSEGLPYLARWMNDEKITLYHSTPTLYRYFLEAAEASSSIEFPDVRAVVLGGEAVEKRDVDLYQQHFSEQTAFVNGLGPSESTVTLQQFITHETSLQLNNVPVGYPVEGTEVLLLNEAGENAQVYGEIAICSQHVALGYWQKEALTQEAFGADPADGKRRLYKTGDLGRLRADGSIEFLGRRDFQIKLRGFRIEPGEIESTLVQHPEIEKAVVVGQGDTAEDQRLVAYVVMSGGNSTERSAEQSTETTEPSMTDELRQFLNQQLPNYMVPSAFVALETLPLTPSGKVDRRSLPAVDISKQVNDELCLPRTEIEEILAGIWCDLLKREEVGVMTNFFELGGHSLLATQVASRIREAFNVELPLRDLFESPTVAALAAAVEKRTIEQQQAEQQGISGETFSIHPVSRVQALPLSFSQQRLWFLDQLEEESSAYILSRSVRLSGGWDIALLKQAIAQLINRHESLRTTIHTVNGEPVQVIAPEVDSAGEIAIPIVDLRSFSIKKAKAEVKRLTKQLASQPFDLAEDELIRFKLVQLPDGDYRLLIAIHHIITDGWSMNILTKELFTAYQDLLQSKPSSLKPLPIQYADFAYWQRQWLQGDELNRQLSYWQQQLADAPTLLSLPTDYPRPAVQTFKGKTHTFKVDKTVSQQLNKLSQRSGTTMFMTLLSAFSVFLYRYAQADDIVVGSPIANRTRKETEPLIGFFVNTLLLRTRLEGDLEFSDLLKQVRRTALDAYAHQDMPFEKLVEVLRPERSRSYNPLFQVMFVLHNMSQSAANKADEPAVDTSDAAQDSAANPMMTTAGTKRTTAKFDLSLSMAETRNGLKGSWTYSTDLFKSETIKAISVQFQSLLADIVRTPDSPIDSFSMLSAAQQKQQILNQALQKKIALLSPAKRALLERNLAKDKQTNAVVRRTEPGAAALSFSQQNIWLLDQLDPGNPGYNRPTHLLLSGPLNVTALEQSIAHLVSRHEILRTRFATSEQGQPVQIVEPEALLKPLKTEDLSALSDDLQKQTVSERAIAQAHAHFDLTALPLFKAQLLKLNAEEHLLLITFHHIVFDGWSTGILLKDLGALYAAFASGSVPVLPDLSVQYADFALWQQQQLKTAGMEKQLTYWKQQLSGQLPILELPADKPRTASQTVKGGEYRFELTDHLKKQLSAIAQQENATLFMLLLTGFKTLLYRYTGEEDIIVGSPVAGRNLVETEQLIGLFANTLVLRTGLQGEQSFQSLLQQVRQTALEAFAHQGVPLPKLVEALQVERDLSRSTLFQILFQFKNLPGQTIEAQGVSLQDYQLETNVTGLDLSLEINEQAKGLSCVFKYNANLFNASTIHKMSTHFLSVVESAVTDLSQPLWALSLLSPQEQQQIEQWSNHQALSHYSQDERCIHQLIEAQVERTPNAIALIDPATDPAINPTTNPTTNHQLTQPLTYQALNQRANQVAHYLRSIGVGPDTLVGVMIDRSANLLVALLGILKAGGAYLPLDPHYPTERLALMAEDAQLQYLLTQQAHLDLLSEPITHTLCLDQDDQTLIDQPTHNPDVCTQPNHLAYVIYTSGSTGIPKGVMVPHQSLVNFTRSAADAYGITHQDRVLQFATVSFDTAAEEIYPCLSTGATLVLRTEEMLTPFSRFVEDCDRWKITVLDLPTAYWQQLVTAMANDQLTFNRSLRLIIIGGERVSPQAVSSWLAQTRQLANAPQLMNTYGPTEATVVATAFNITEPPESEVSIGRPLPHVTTHVLDTHQQPVPAGVPGELYIGGHCLARGYWNRPDLDAENFVTASSGVLAGNRLYKTGDLVKQLPSGELEFLSRIDNQIKIRGFRVELSEVETALQKHPWAKEAVVVTHQDANAQQRLVAYLTIAASAQVEEALSEAALPDWRSHLKKQLPDYMIPSAFVVLETLPLTPSGKVDRKQLPQPDFSQLTLASQYEAPTTATEQTLVKLWSGVLDVSTVGINDDFFELGGHSLLAVQLFSDIEKAFGKKLPLATLFQATTIKGLATVLDQEDWSAPWESLVAIKPQGTKPPLFYLHAGGGNLLVYRDLAISLGDDQPVYGLQPRGLDGSLLPSTDIQEMATFYIEQIKTLQPTGPYYFAGLSTGGLIAWEMAQQLHQQQESTGLLALFDTGGPGYPALLPVAPRITSVISWFVSDSLQRIKRGLPLMVEGIQREGFVATWRQVLVKLKVLTPAQPALPATSKDTSKTKTKAKSASNNKPVVQDDQAIINELLTDRFNRSIAQYKKQNAGNISWEVRINLFLAQLLRRSSQSYYANYFTKGLFRSTKSAKVVKNSTLPAELQQVEAANRRAKKQYVPQPYPGKAVLFRATDRAPGIAPDRELGWRGMTGQGLEVYDIPGAHSSMIDSPLLSHYLKECLQQAQEEYQEEGIEE